MDQMNSTLGKQTQTILSLFKESPDWARLSDNTKRVYSHYLEKLLTYAEEATLPFEVTSSPNENPMQLPVAVAFNVAQWNNIFAKFDGPHAQRMARRVFLILSAWGRKRGLLSYDHSESFPQPVLTKQDKLPLNKEEAEKLATLLANKAYPNRFKPYLSSALLAFQTGMRPNEVADLLWEDVGSEFISIRGAKAKQKGVVSRMVRITEGVKSVIDSCLLGRNPLHGNHVYSSVEGRRLNKDTRSQAIHVACRMAGIPEREFYSTRRGTATEMFKAGYDVAQIQKQLGHANIQTTMIYIKPTMQEAASQFKGF